MKASDGAAEVWGPPDRVESRLSPDSPSLFQDGKYDEFSQQGVKGEMSFG